MSRPLVSIADQIAEVERELVMRARVYPTRVRAGRMTPEQAANQTAAMEAALATLRAVARGELLL